MTRKQYAVHTVRDEPVRLRDQLDHIAADGGRVVSVIWQPARQATLSLGCRHTKSHRATSLFPSMSCPRQWATEGRSAARLIVAQACPIKIRDRLSTGTAAVRRLC
jgi:hypothetical protein